MKLTGVNMSNVKTANHSAVLYLLNKNGNMSRKDIAEYLGLTQAAVSKISRELIEKNCICELGEEDTEASKAGRRKILLSLNYDGNLTVSVSIETNYCAYGLYTLDAKPIASGVVPFDEDKSAEEYIKSICKNIKFLIEESNTDFSKIIGVGVGVVGSVNENGETVGTYGLWGKGIKIKEIFEKELELDCVVENNVKAFADAHLIFSDSQEDENLLFVKWGPGVGSAIVIGSKVLKGTDNSAAEIGHYIVKPDGEKCRCGRRGCLETQVSARAIIDSVKNFYSKEKTPILYEKTDGNVDNINVLKLLGSDKLDECVLDHVDKRINRMARAVVNAATIIDPDRVIIFGSMFTENVNEKFITYCKKYYERFNENYIKLSEFQDKADYIGPAAIAIKELFYEKSL